MSLAIAINLRTYVLAAGDVLNLSAVGNFVRCLEATATFKLAIDDGEQTDFFKGLSYRLPEGAEFSRLTIVNTSGVSNTIQLAMALGEVDDTRLSLTGGTLPVIDRSPNVADATDVSCTATAVTAIFGANDDTAEMLIQNNSGLATPLRVGATATVGASRGLKLADGATITIRGAGGVSIYNPNGSAATVSVLYTTWA